MFEQGTGTTKNKVNAYVWYSMAKTQGHAAAEEALDRVKATMSNVEIELAQTKALDCYEANFEQCL